jgi:hypothetical protein
MTSLENEHSVDGRVGLPVTPDSATEPSLEFDGKDVYMISRAACAFYSRMTEIDRVVADLKELSELISSVCWYHDEAKDATSYLRDNLWNLTLTEWESIGISTEVDPYADVIARKWKKEEKDEADEAQSRLQYGFENIVRCLDALDLAFNHLGSPTSKLNDWLRWSKIAAQESTKDRLALASHYANQLQAKLERKPAASKEKENKDQLGMSSSTEA